MRIGIKTGYIGKLLNGEPLSPIYAVRFVSYIRSKGQAEAKHEGFVAFCDYLKQLGIADPFSHSDSTIADLLLEPEPDNYFVSPTEKFVSLFRMSKVDKYVIAQQRSSDSNGR